MRKEVPVFGREEELGTFERPIIDSALRPEEALMQNPALECPESILARQALLEVTYRGFDSLWHRGQIVCDARLLKDVQEAFDLAVVSGFPFGAVIPAADPRYAWSDEGLMAANVSSGFNYRHIAGTKRLSNHALGFAIDLNPLKNPLISAEGIFPPGANYEPGVAGTLHTKHPIVELLKSRGWTWGGDWESLKDYQHFEKPLAL